MKLKTPFTGRLADLVTQSRGGLRLALGGVWEVAQGAIVYHRTRIGELEFGPATEIGLIQRVEQARMVDGRMVLLARGVGTEWLATLLDTGTHALAVEMDLMHSIEAGVITSGRIRAAMLVQASAYAWAKEVKA